MEGKSYENEQLIKKSSLYRKWLKTEEKKILEEYIGEAIEKVPEEYREKIARLREFGLGTEKTTFEQVLEFLETHDGKIMKGYFEKNGKILKRSEMTKEQLEEVQLYDKWKRTEERKILKEYAGRPIEEVPEKYREKIARLREYGLGTKKSKLSKAKQQRDEAKAKNRKAKKLEQQVSAQLEKRGKAHEE